MALSVFQENLITQIDVKSNLTIFQSILNDQYMMNWLPGFKLNLEIQIIQFRIVEQEEQKN